MGSNDVCGNCSNFKPKQGDKFFNCTKAEQAGVKYGMQVRADTRACDAFAVIPPPVPPKVTPKPPTPVQRTEARQTARLCNWGRAIIIAVVLLVVLLLAWGLYTCASGIMSPAPTPTPTPAPTAASNITPAPEPSVIEVPPTPTPIPKISAQAGQMVSGSYQIVGIYAIERTKQYKELALHTAPLGTVFIRVTATIINISSYNIKVSANDFKLVDSLGIVFNNQSGHALSGELPNDKILAAGKTTDGEISYLIPETSSDLEIIAYIDGRLVGWQLPW